MHFASQLPLQFALHEAWHSLWLPELEHFPLQSASHVPLQFAEQSSDPGSAWQLAVQVPLQDVEQSADSVP